MIWAVIDFSLAFPACLSIWSHAQPSLCPALRCFSLSCICSAVREAAAGAGKHAYNYQACLGFQFQTRPAPAHHAAPCEPRASPLALTVQNVRDRAGPNAEFPFCGLLYRQPSRAELRGRGDTHSVLHSVLHCVTAASTRWGLCSLFSPWGTTHS